MKRKGGGMREMGEREDNRDLERREMWRGRKKDKERWRERKRKREGSRKE